MAQQSCGWQYSVSSIEAYYIKPSFNCVGTAACRVTRASASMDSAVKFL
jgi:hypothetical protein